MGAEIDPSTEEKEQRRFATVKRGYDRGQVDAFLVSIASSIDALEAGLREFRARPSSAPTDVPHGTAERIEKFGEDAELEVEEMLEEARAEAAAIVAEAGDQADRITRDAQGAAVRSVEEASTDLTRMEAEARRIPSDVAQRRRQMIEETQAMQERLLRIATELDLVVKQGT